MSRAPKLRILRRAATESGPAAGRRLVLVHGSMDRATSFTRLMGRLRRLGHRRLRPSGLRRLGRDRAADDLRRSGRRSPRGPQRRARRGLRPQLRRRRRAGDGRLPAGTHPGRLRVGATATVAALVGRGHGPADPGRRSWSRTSGPSRLCGAWSATGCGNACRPRPGPSGAGKATRSRPRSTAWPWRLSSTPPPSRSPCWWVGVATRPATSGGRRGRARRSFASRRAGRDRGGRSRRPPEPSGGGGPPARAGGRSGLSTGAQHGRTRLAAPHRAGGRAPDRLTRRPARQGRPRASRTTRTCWHRRRPDASMSR